MRFDDRYAMAIRSSNLRSEEKTLHSSTDILGAAGMASKENALAMALLRLFCGDRRMIGDIIEQLSDRAVGKAYRMDEEIGRVSATLVSRLVLDWYLDARCKHCGGHGFMRMAGAPALSDQACTKCKGQGRRDFDSMFPGNRKELARWLAGKLEREMGMAGPAAMAALAPRLNL